jgi:hypothetical protein
VAFTRIHHLIEKPIRSRTIRDDTLSPHMARERIRTWSRCQAQGVMVACHYPLYGQSSMGYHC